MSKENPRITQEIKWKDAWKEDEREYLIRVKYRRRGSTFLPDPWIWEPIRTDGKDRNWKRYRDHQWKVKREP